MSASVYSRIERLKDAVGEQRTAICKRMEEIHGQVIGRPELYKDHLAFDEHDFQSSLLYLNAADTAASILAVNWNGILDAGNEENYLEALSALASGDLDEMDWFIAVNAALLAWKSSLPPDILSQHHKTRYNQLEDKEKLRYRGYLITGAKLLLELITSDAKV